MEKIKIQHLADSLGISRVTVWKVLNNKKGVSPKTMQLVKDALKKMGISDIDNGKGNAYQHLKHITLIASRVDTSVFWATIINQIVSEVHKLGINLQYLPVDTPRVDGKNLLSRLEDLTDGIIVVNIYDKILTECLSDLNVPKVFLDTLPSLNVNDARGDFILLEGERLTKKITLDMIKNGCRRIGFIGDANYAKTNMLRYNGYLNAMAESGLHVDHNLCLTNFSDSDSWRSTINSFLKDIKEMPDGIVCVNDYTAYLLVNLLSEHDIEVPRDMLLSGYDNCTDFFLDKYNITTVQVDTSMLGKRIVSQILYRAENPNADFEEIYVNPKIINRF